MNIASQSKLKWRTDSPCCVHVNYSDTLSHRNGLIICHIRLGQALTFTIQTSWSCVMEERMGKFL